MKSEEMSRPFMRRRPHKRKTALRTILTIFIVAVVCTAVIIGALFVSGIRVVREETPEGALMRSGDRCPMER